jgi:hypothetical protein
MQRPDLQSLVSQFQIALRLRDWRISASYRPDLVDSSGHALWSFSAPNIDAKSARLVIRDPATPPAGVSSVEAADQVTRSVASELTRLHFAAFESGSPTDNVAIAQAVDALATAIVGNSSPASMGAVRARVAPSPPIVERHRYALLVARELFGMRTAADGEVEVETRLRRPEILGDRQVTTRLGPIVLSRRELVHAAHLVSKRAHRGDEYERLVNDYASRKLANKLATSGRKVT